MSFPSGGRREGGLTDHSIVADEPQDRISNKRRATRPGQFSRPGSTAEGQETARAASDRTTLLIDLALQGGGSHGAFTWGVLDRLLEETWLRFDGISGTSAGAMNAVVMASGHAEGGPEGARAALEAF